MAKTLIMKTKCPECGARMKVDIQAETARCEYCGTTARIADKKKPPPQLPPNAVQVPLPVIWVSSGSSTSWVWILSTLFPLLIFGFVFYTVSRQTPLGNMLGFGNSTDGSGSGPGSGGGAGQSFGEHMQWAGKHTMLVDLTGDGVMDVIGWVRFLNMGGGTSYDRIAAFDAVSGNRLWDTGPIADASNSYEVRAALVGDKLVVADAGGMLKAFLLAGGTLSWQSVLGERAEKICGAEAGVAAVYTKDQRILKVPVATGLITPSGQWNRETPCPLLQTDSGEVGPYFVKEDVDVRDRYDAIPGMAVESIVTDNATGKTIGLGYRKPGTGTPTAAGFQFVHEKKKTNVVTSWMSSITSLNPLTVKEGAPKHAAAAVGRVVIAYETKGTKSGARISCLDENTGQILWDVAIPRSDTGSISSLSVSNHHVFVGHWTYLDIFQLLDGAHKLTIGVW